MRYGGRTKGTPNKVTKELRETFLNLVNRYLVTDIESLPPNKRIETLTKLLPYIIPPANDIELEAENIEPLTIILHRDTNDIEL